MAASETSERQIFGVTIGVFALVLVVVGLFVFLSVRKLNQLNKDAEKYETDRKAAQVIADNLDKRKKEKQETESRVAECNQYLPKDDDVERMLLSLSGKSSEAGLDSTSLKKEAVQAAQARPGQSKAAYETIRYKGDFEGSFHQLAKFISAVENWQTFKRFVNITAFSVDAADKGQTFDDGNQKHKVKMTLELYKYQEPVAVPAGPATKGTKPATPAK